MKCMGCGVLLMDANKPLCSICFNKEVAKEDIAAISAIEGSHAIIEEIMTSQPQYHMCTQCGDIIFPKSPSQVLCACWCGKSTVKAISEITMDGVETRLDVRGSPEWVFVINEETLKELSRLIYEKGTH